VKRRNLESTAIHSISTKRFLPVDAVKKCPQFEKQLNGGVLGLQALSAIAEAAQIVFTAMYDV
jgi:hypothetical protein